jgi:hypothetical protein
MIARAQIVERVIRKSEGFADSHLTLPVALWTVSIVKNSLRVIEGSKSVWEICSRRLADVRRSGSGCSPPAKGSISCYQPEPIPSLRARGRFG